jgi:hypothetical protein
MLLSVVQAALGERASGQAPQEQGGELYRVVAAVLHGSRNSSAAAERSSSAEPGAVAAPASSSHRAAGTFLSSSLGDGVDGGGGGGGAENLHGLRRRYDPVASYNAVDSLDASMDPLIAGVIGSGEPALPSTNLDHRDAPSQQQQLHLSRRLDRPIEEVTVRDGAALPPAAACTCPIHTRWALGSVFDGDSELPSDSRRHRVARELSPVAQGDGFRCTGAAAAAPPAAGAPTDVAAAAAHAATPAAAEGAQSSVESAPAEMADGTAAAAGTTTATSTYGAVDASAPDVAAADHLRGDGGSYPQQAGMPYRRAVRAAGSYDTQPAPRAPLLDTASKAWADVAAVTGGSASTTLAVPLTDAPHAATTVVGCLHAQLDGLLAEVHTLESDRRALAARAAAMQGSLQAQHSRRLTALALRVDAALAEAGLPPTM